MNGTGRIGLMDLKNLILDGLGLRMTNQLIMSLYNQWKGRDGLVGIDAVLQWRKDECLKQEKIIFADPTANWGKTPSTATQEVGWLVARNKELIIGRQRNQHKWTQPKNSCAETQYADEYAKFGKRRRGEHV